MCKLRFEHSGKGRSRFERQTMGNSAKPEIIRYSTLEKSHGCFADWMRQIICGCVLKSNVNRIKSRTAKFENKKSKLACEGRSEISLVAKLILRLIFKRLHPRVSCLHPQRKMRKFRARWRSARANFFHAVLLVALVLLCDSVALKCEKANQTSRKCAGKIYFLSKELGRAAELQEGFAIAVITVTSGLDTQTRLMGHFPLY